MEIRRRTAGRITQQSRVWSVNSGAQRSWFLNESQISKFTHEKRRRYHGGWLCTISASAIEHRFLREALTAQRPTIHTRCWWRSAFTGAERSHRSGRIIHDENETRITLTRSRTGWHWGFRSAAEANIHRGVSRERNVVATTEKVHVNRPGAAVGAHQDGRCVRAHRQACDDAH